MSRPTLTEAVYRLLLHALPARFREEHVEEMLAWLREHRARLSPSGPLGWLRFWAPVLRDLARTVVVERVRPSHTTRPDGAPRRQETTSMDTLVQDVRAALRSFTHRPAFTLLVVGTLALGVGSATAVYSVIHDVVMAPLPYPDAERIVRVGKISEGRAGVLSVSGPDLTDLTVRNRSFAALAASRPAGLTIAGDGEPELVRVGIVSAAFFDVVDVHPVLGASWDEAADAVGAPARVVLSHGLWMRRWGGDPALLGRAITLDGGPVTVTGVMPAGFVPPEGLGQSGMEAWVPLSFLDPEARAQRRNGMLQLLGRLRADVTPAFANEELEALGAQLSVDFPEAGARRFGLSPLRTETVGDVASTLLPLLAAAALLLVIASINVANLLLMRANERASELALRSCLGAGRGRLVRQLMTEGLLYGGVGGLLGTFVAMAGVNAFGAMGPSGIPRLAEVGVDRSILLYAMAISAGTSVLFSLLPALRGSRAGAAHLAGGGRGGVGSRGEARVRDGLVVMETSLALVLVVSGGLLLNSLLRLGRVELGFSPDGVAAVSVLHPGGEGEDPRRFFAELVERSAALPGVRAAGATSALPLVGHDQLRVSAAGLAMDEDDRADGGLPVMYEVVTPGYFEAIGIEVRRGRDFSGAEGASDPPVAIVNAALARRLAPDGDAVGARLTLGDDPEGLRPIEIVGVVADARQERVEEEAEEEIFFPLAQRSTRRMDVVARGTPAGASLLPAMRAEVWAVRPELPVRRSVDMTAWVAASLADRRFLAVLVGAFAGLALALTLVGVYGTLAYAVSQRRRELGVRIAMGASRRAVVADVLGRALRTLALGIGIGVVASLLGGRLVASLLYEVGAADPVTLGLGVLTVLGTGMVAALVPARRALAVEPTEALRGEG